MASAALILGCPDSDPYVPPVDVQPDVPLVEDVPEREDADAAVPPESAGPPPKKPCTADGFPCPDNEVCIEQTCVPCPEGETVCFEQQVLECAEHFQEYTLTACEGETYCQSGFCIACYPGTVSCGGDLGNEVWKCADDGSAVALEMVCPVGTKCLQGYCVDPCSDDFKTKSSVGCDYYAVDLENADIGGFGVEVVANDAQFAVVASNPDPDLAVSVSVHETFGGPAIVGLTAEIPPLGLEVFKLPPRNVTGTVRGELAWYISGTRPFVAHQFNPLDNEHPVYSNDASLLLPAKGVGSEYLVITGQTTAFLTVVGVTQDTEVTITPTANIEPAADESVPFIKENTPWTVTLGPGEVVNLRSQLNDKDLTGSHVIASDPVIVFAGNQGAFAADKCCADHLEQQQLPLAAWGAVAAVGRSAARGVAPDHWRVLAAADGTSVTFEPEVSAALTLNRGEWVQFSAGQDFVATANHPIQVAQVLAGSHEITIDGGECNVDKPCGAGQQCVSPPGTTVGKCRTTCAVANADCADPAQACHEKSWNYPSVLSPGDGLCYPKACSGGADCPGACVDGFCTPACADCGCNAANFYFCAGDDVCDVLDEACHAHCTPVAAECPDEKYYCLAEQWLGGATLFEQGICAAPYCNTDADCPNGHGCVVSEGPPPYVCEPIGDPALILWPPVAVWRDHYVLLSPEAYRANFVTIVVPDGATATVDGADVGELSAVGASGYSATRLALEPGVHVLTGTAPVGVVAYGFDDDVSYGYSGGSNLSDLP